MHKVQNFSTPLNTYNLSTRKRQSPEYPYYKCKKREGQGLRFLGYLWRLANQHRINLTRNKMSNPIQKYPTLAGPGRCDDR